VRPVVVSITTLPSRIAMMRPCLESLLQGVVRPDRIILPLPAMSIREQTGYTIPAFLRDPSFLGSIIEVVEADRDWGPGTKLLGALRHLPPECHLVIADDDVRYRPRFLADLVDAQRRDHAASFSYYTYGVGGLTVGQGCDGFSFWSPNLAGAREFAESYVDSSEVRFHDDLWISFYLATRGIKVRSLAHLLGNGPIYEPEHEINALSRLTGELARDRINRQGLKRLLQEVPVSPRTRLEIRVRSIVNSVRVRFRRLRQPTLREATRQ
jgi:hypothetical protein